MPYDNDTFRKYARLLLETGVNLQPGQCLAVMGEPVHWNFMVLLAEEAYLAGARFVEIDAPHPRVLKARIDHAPAEHLDFVPGYRTVRYEEYVKDHWARIALTGQEDMDLFEKADQKRNGKIQKAFREVAKPFMKACSAGEVPWCVAAVPTPAWAARIFDCEADEAACTRLWALMEKVLRLDQPEPAAVWRGLAERMENRAKVLNDYACRAAVSGAAGVHLQQAVTSICPTFPPRRFLPHLPTGNPAVVQRLPGRWKSWGGRCMAPGLNLPAAAWWITELIAAKKSWMPFSLSMIAGATWAKWPWWIPLPRFFRAGRSFITSSTTRMPPAILPWESGIRRVLKGAKP